MLRGEHRAEIMIKIESGASMQRARKMMREAMADHSAKEEFKGVKITVDVDA
jgi:hypothetical protein